MSRVVIPEEVEGVWRLSFEESTDLLPSSLRRVYLKISPQRFDLASPTRFCSQVNAMCRRGRKVREDGREEENSSGSVFSNYLR